MKKELYVYRKDYGEIGKPVFKDSLGKQLCIGDIVVIVDDTDCIWINIIVDSFVMGWKNASKNGDFDNISVYKLIDYTDVENLDKRIVKAMHINFEIEEKRRKITMKQLEEIVGEPFEIVKEDNN